MTRHLGMKLTARSSAILDVCLDIARQQAPLANVSLPSFFMGLLDQHARELGLRPVMDDDGKLLRIMRIVSSAEPSGRVREETIQVWPRSRKPSEFTIVGGTRKGDSES